MEKEIKNSLNWKEIGQRFKVLRKSRNLSQEKIGGVSDQNESNISKLENGEKPASINYALFLRNEFGASFDWLYDGAEIHREYEDVQKEKVFDPHAIGVRLKSIRLSEGLNKEEFGKVIGVTGQTIARFEAGVQKPEIKTALKIKRALKKPLDWIYFGDKCIGTSNRVQPPIATKPYIPLKQLKRELKEEAMSYIKGMNESELAMLTTRLRMEQKHNTALSDSTTQDRLGSNQIKSNQIKSNQIKSNQSSQESKKKSRL